MNHISLFSGIGGFELAAEWAGWNNIASCEINPFGRKVLEYYWPNAYHHDDIHTLTKEILDEKTDWKSDELILTGGFPCQPYSVAGKRLGKEDERHLWPQMLRIIRELKPRWIVGENVFGLVNWNNGLVFDEVQTDLEAEGYEVQALVLPACAVNAPHRRERVWIVAYSNKCTKGSPRTSCRTDRKGSKNINEQEERRKQTEQFIGHGNVSRLITNSNNERGCKGLGQFPGQDGKVPERHKNTEPCDAGGGTTANAKSESSQRLRPEQQEFSNAKQKQLGGNGSEVDNATTTKADLKRQQERDIARQSGGEGRRFSETFSPPENWEVFPTQSPVCNGDDGLSTRLDGITFSKWRNESIKAGGNAIVPQVVYQIFKAINEYQRTH